MKSIKTEYIILGIVIVIISAYLVFHNQNSGSDNLPVLTDLTDTDITKIDITRNDKTISLIKKDSDWVTGEDGFPIDPVQIKAITANVKSIKLTSVVSESEDYSRYDLDDEHKIKIAVFNNEKPVLTFDLGKTASSYRHTFIRFDGDPRVFHAEQNFREGFDKKENELLNKRIMSFDSRSASDVNGITDKISFGFTKKAIPVKKEPDLEQTEEEKVDSGKTEPDEQIWTNTSGEKIEDGKLKDFLSTFENLSCEKYIKNSKKEDYDNPLAEINLTGTKNISLKIYAQRNDEDGFPAVSTESPFPFILSEDTVEEIRTNLKELLN